MLRSRTTAISLFISAALLLGACGPGTRGESTATPSPLPATATEAPAERQPTATPTDAPTPTAVPAAGWVKAEDPRSGVRFAVPCYWQVRLPSEGQDPGGLGAFPVTNYSDAFLERYEDKQSDEVWEAGGMKVDFVYFHPSTWGLAPGATLRAFAEEAMGGDETISEMVSLTEVVVNEQEGLEVVTRDVRSGEIGHTILFRLDQDLILGLSPVPGPAYEHPDIQGIVHSVALGTDSEVAIPAHPPAPPPGGEDAACLEE